MLEPRQAREPLTEDEFDIRRACGLLFLCIRANSIQVVIKILNYKYNAHNLLISISGCYIYSTRMQLVVRLSHLVPMLSLMSRSTCHKAWFTIIMTLAPHCIASINVRLQKE